MFAWLGHVEGEGDYEVWLNQSNMKAISNSAFQRVDGFGFLEGEGSTVE